MKRVAETDVAMIDQVDLFVIAYMGHRRGEDEATTRNAIANDAAVRESYMRKCQRATLAMTAAGFDLRAAPAVPSTPKG